MTQKRLPRRHFQVLTDALMLSRYRGVKILARLFSLALARKPVLHRSSRVRTLRLINQNRGEQIFLTG